MTDHLIRRVVLTGDNIGSRESMASFMKEALQLPDYFGGNLDALSDLLSEVTEETVFEIEESELAFIPEEGYAAKTLKVLDRAAEENPHIHLYLTDGF